MIHFRKRFKQDFKENNKLKENKDDKILLE